MLAGVNGIFAKKITNRKLLTIIVKRLYHRILAGPKYASTSSMFWKSLSGFHKISWTIAKQCETWFGPASSCSKIKTFKNYITQNFWTLRYCKPLISHTYVRLSGGYSILMFKSFAFSNFWIIPNAIQEFGTNESIKDRNIFMLLTTNTSFI